MGESREDGQQISIQACNINTSITARLIFIRCLIEQIRIIFQMGSRQNQSSTRLKQPNYVS